MGNGRHIYIISVLMAVCILSLTGCVERELKELPSHGMLHVEFFWPEESTVEGTRVWIRDSRGNIHADETCSADRHSFRVPEDTYSLRSVNTDLVNAFCADSQTIHAMEDAETGLLLNIANVFCSGADGVGVKRGDSPTEMKLTHKNLVKTIRLVLHMENIGDFDRMEILLSGIVPSVRIDDCLDAGEPEKYVGATILGNTRADNGNTYRAEMSVFGWRWSNVLTARIHHHGGADEVSIPQEINEILDSLSENGGEVFLTLPFEEGKEIGLSISVSAWHTGSGSATVG